ncbi:Peptidoglycan/xylan/chitin deacetylase, PgdA/CDA1 family [Paenibacillus sp. UNCCL117]|uniref:polysaccharide deacetylase n=1 Tax=unclassified Paenibacillus TaxID=185978 RepID=UPI0008822EDB|nr:MULTISPECIES: polysaccharide deacetylase [unclassified Paenibacillus]SDD90119.1 Peptidoglycan/xylan/chitin deacetylase, PgdA/CDA1 family [Paenibacillus sp. cl123]SFW43992.1 Peptidoglycan/xylan/chitin deacetylase, PgdA/CDA1 family [Paenibacillus sp. UNCCL117]
MKLGWLARDGWTKQGWMTALLALIIWLGAAAQGLAAADLSALRQPAAEGSEAGEVFSLLSQGNRLTPEKPYMAPEQPTVYLTFDDGPSGLTPQVLNLLREEGIQATFFVLGEHVEARADVVKRIVDEGHAIGNHSYNHVYKEIYSDFNGYWEQLQKTEAAIMKLTGVRTPLVRAPGGTAGNYDEFYHYYMQQGGYTVFDWSIDSGDARRAGVKAEEIVRMVEKGPFRHEVNVLLHDGAGHEETLKALPQIIRSFQERGYRFAPLSAEVKPAQFGVTACKWARTASLFSFQEQLAAVRQHTAVWAGSAGTGPFVSEVAAAGEQALAAEGMMEESRWAYGDGEAAGAGTGGEGEAGAGTGTVTGIGTEAGAENEASAQGGPGTGAGTGIERSGIKKSVAGLLFYVNTRWRTGVQVMERAVQEPSSLVRAAGTETKLQLQADKPAAEFGLSSIRLKDGRFIVPLRELAEAMKADVAWNPDERTAVVKLGTRELAYDLARLELRSGWVGGADLQSQAAHSRKVSLPEMELRDGKLYVPLRAAVEGLGGRIADYEAAGGHGPARVQAALPPGLMPDIRDLFQQGGAGAEHDRSKV